MEMVSNVQIQQRQQAPNGGGGGGAGQQQGGGGGGRGTKRSRSSRPKRENLHVLLVLQTSSGCRLAADSLLEDMRNCNAQPAELVASIVGKLEREYQSGACVDEHTMDQVIIYMALADGVSQVKGPAKEARTSLHVETAIHMGE